MSFPWLDLVFEELIDLEPASSTIWAGASSSKEALGSTKTSGWMGASSWTLSWTCSQCRKDTRSADSSRMGASLSEQMYRGPRSRASPIMNFGGRKFACLTSMYERRGLSTNRAWPNACQVEYIGSTSRIRWDARSYLSQCTKISDLSTKFRSWTCTTLRSFLNFLVSAWKQYENWLEIVRSNQNW